MPAVPPRRHRRLVAALAGLLTVLTLTACSSGSSGTSGTTPSPQTTRSSARSTAPAPQSAAYCAAWAQVRSDFAAYRSIDVVSGGLNSVRTYLDRLDTSVQQLRAAADEQLRVEVDAFTASLKTLGDTMTTATLPVDRRAQVRAASAEVDARWNELLAAASPGCPGTP